VSKKPLIAGDAPPKRARKSRKSRSKAQHQMAVGRVRAYSPRGSDQKAIAERVRAILHELVPFDLRPTVRHVYYRLVEAHLIEKTEDAYKKWQEQSVRMRKGGYIALDSMIDSSREFLTWRLYTRPSDALLDAAYSYARDPWLDQEEAVCLVCEAETHKEMLRPLAEEYGCPLFPMKGSASLSKLLELVAWLRGRWEEHRQTTVLLYCGDHDPAGVEMSRTLYKRLVELHMPPLAARVVRVMVTEGQIRTHEPPLQTRPPKASDTRTPWYERQFPGLGCVELDAFPPQEVIAAMRAALEDRITDRAAWARNEEDERAVRGRLVDIIEQLRVELDRPLR
jgi:hypothetical protein